MPGQCRVGDKAMTPVDNHACPQCPHDVNGPAISGSPDVFINKLEALRQKDKGWHSACCGQNSWEAAKGSMTVFINKKAAMRVGDLTKHCGAPGLMAEGSSDVIVGG